MKEVPNGTVKSSELEREHGKLIYSFDITVPGKTGIDEVNVNAIDGSVVAKAHESPKTEKKEAAKEAKEKKTTKQSPEDCGIAHRRLLRRAKALLAMTLLKFPAIIYH